MSDIQIPNDDEMCTMCPYTVKATYCRKGAEDRRNAHAFKKLEGRY